MKTVNDKNVRGCSFTPHPPTSEEGRPERVPCAGNGNGTSLNNAGSNGNYWSSVPNSDNNNAYELNFNSSNHNTNNNNRNNGQSVRPVQESAACPGDGVPHRGLEFVCGRGVDGSRLQSMAVGRLLLRRASPQTEEGQRLLADLIVAYHDARRHKRGRDYQTRFEMNQERELVRLRDELLERRYVARPCSCFIIHDPKMREVFAAEFRDRVVHHLFYNYTHEIFERMFIADSYSCIEGRGTHYGVDRLKHHLLSCSQNWTKPCYVLKLDVKGYFMSINRARLLARCRKILDGHRLQSKAVDSHRLVDYLLESICLLDPVANCRVIGDRDEWKKLPPEKSLFHSKSGCGLPIGNLSSQLFSNIYLGALDDFMKRELKCRHYGRYVDDAFVVGESKEGLYAVLPRVRDFLRDELELELNERKVRVTDAYKGVEFLGAYVKPHRTYPSTRSLRRMRGRMKSLDWREGAQKVQARVNSMLGVLSHYDCYLKRKVLVYEAGLRKCGRVTEDCLKFEPERVFDSNRLLSRAVDVSCSPAGGVGGAAPEVASPAVAEAHVSPAKLAFWRDLVNWAACCALFLHAGGGHALGESTLLHEGLAVLPEQAVEHHERAGDEDQHRVGEDDAGVSIAIDSIRWQSTKPPRELAALGDDVRGEIVVDVLAVVGGVEAHGIDRLGLGRIRWPGREVHVKEPGEVVVAQFAERCLGDVDELKGGLHRGREAFASLGEVLDAGAGGLDHLVELASAGVVAEREEAAAEHERLELDDVHQYVGVEALVAGGVPEERRWHGVGLSFGCCSTAIDCHRLLSTANYNTTAHCATRRRQ